MQAAIISGLIVGVLSLVMGFIWYGPLFANMWMKEVGLSTKDLESSPMYGYLLAFLSSTLLGFITSVLLTLSGLTTAVEGLAFGGMLGVGYVATTFATNYVFAQKTLRLYLIDTGYQVLLVIVAGLVAVLVG